MNILKRFLLTGTAIVLATGIVACDKQHPAESVGKSIDEATEKAGDKIGDVSKDLGEQSTKAGEVLDDTAITAKAKAAILMEPGLRVLRIKVDTKNGVTTLSGSVDSQKNSAKATEIAGAVAGVKSVENLLVVKATE